MAAPDAILLGRLAVERGLATPDAVDTALAAVGIEGGADAMRDALATGADATAVEKLAALAEAAADAGRRNLIGDPRRFGALAVDAGLVSADALTNALESQASLRERGIPKRLGTLLVARGDMPPAAVRQALAMQGAAILNCDECGARFNVLGAKGARPDCPMCHHGLSTSGPGDAVEVEGTLVAAPAPRRSGTPPKPRSVSRAIRARVAKRRQFAGYEIDQEIARGGMGIVYRAHQPNLDRPVALKVLLAGDGASEEMVNRLYAEAEAAARLRHPNIVAVHDVGKYENSHYICMDFIEGETLEVMLKRQDHLSPKRAAQLAKSLAEALQYAHEQGIVHRDLKPANVMLEDDGRPVLTDFGLAKDLAVDKGLTTGSAVLGTPDYMSPEQARGQSRKIDGRSDVFGLGALLYHMLAGSTPFGARTPMKTMHNVVALEPSPPSADNPAVPRELDAICRKALEKNPKDRYADAAAMAADLGRWLDGQPVLAEPPNAWRNFMRRLRRDRRLQRTLAVSAASMVLGSILTLLFVGGGGPAKPPKPDNGHRPAPPDPAQQQREALRQAIAGHLEDAQSAEREARLAARDDFAARSKALAAALASWAGLATLMAEDHEARTVAAGHAKLRDAQDAEAQKTRLRRKLSDVWVDQAAARGAEREWTDTPFRLALRDLKKAIEIDQDNGRAFSLRGILRALRTWRERPSQKLPAATLQNIEFDLDRALEANPADADALAARALVLTNRNLHPQALAICDEADRAAAENPLALYVRGLASFRSAPQSGPQKTSFLQRAEAAFEKAHTRALANREPVTAARAAVYLAYALKGLGRPDEALGVLDRYLMSGSNAEAHHSWAVEARVLRSWLHEEAGRIELAIADLEFIERANPAHPEMKRLKALREKRKNG